MLRVVQEGRGENEDVTRLISRGRVDEPVIVQAGESQFFDPVLLVDVKLVCRSDEAPNVDVEMKPTRKRQCQMIAYRMVNSATHIPFTICVPLALWLLVASCGFLWLLMALYGFRLLLLLWRLRLCGRTASYNLHDSVASSDL